MTASASTASPRPIRGGRRRARAFEITSAETSLPPFAGGAVGFFGYDLVRTVEPLGAPNPDPVGLPDMSLMVCELMLAFDHLKHEVTVLAYAFCEDERSTPPTIAPWPCIDEAREALRGPVPPPRPRPDGRGPGTGARLVRARGNARSVALEPLPRAVRGQRRADHRVRARRRRLPGRPLAALLGAGAGRGVLDLSRAAHGQPLALHVLPRVRRLPDRRRLARAAGQGQRPPGRDPADRRHLPARRLRGGGPPPGRRPCSPIRRSAPST